jgi:hypothetical protein
MDLEHLTKSQVMLLALLVAIVSSATTGIVTISLMGQAPPMVAANVGNIIERTVQQVIFATSTEPTEPRALTAAAVMSVKSPSASDAIAKIQKSVIRIMVQGDTAGKLVARGLIIGKDSAITDAASLTPGLRYEAILHDGSIVPIALPKAASSSALAIIELKAATTTLIAATIAGTDQLQLGAEVVRIGGYGEGAAALGIIAEHSDGNIIQADVPSAVPGSVLIDMKGSVIGMTTTDSLLLGQTYYTLLK